MRHRPGTTASCLLLLLSLLLLVTTQAGPDQEQEGMNNKNPSKWKLLQLLSSPPSRTLAAYWMTIKNKYLALATAPLSFLSPHKPSTEVKSGEEEKRGTGEKVKGAVGKSMEKTKETIEESEIGGEMESVDKIEKTISSQDEL